MKNVTWSWVIWILFLIIGLSILSWVVYAVLSTLQPLISYYITMHHALDSNFYFFLEILVITSSIGITSIIVAWLIFSKSTGIRIRDYYSLTHLKQILALTKRRKDEKLTRKEKRQFAYDWYLSYYKSFIVIFITTLFLGSGLITPIILSYYHIKSTFEINLILTFIFYSMLIGFFIAYFYIIERNFHCFCPEAIFRTFTMDFIKQRSLESKLLSPDERKKMRIDMRAMNSLIKNINYSKLTREEKFGIAEFRKNIPVIYQFLRYSNKTSFNKVSKVLKDVCNSLIHTSNPQTFLENYYQLKIIYKELREKEPYLKFTSNKLYNINKNEWNKLVAELDTFKVIQIVWKVFVFLVPLILFVLYLLHSGSINLNFSLFGSS